MISLRDLIPADYLHPLDREAMATLKKVPGLTEIVRKVNSVGLDRLVHMEYMANTKRPAGLAPSAVSGYRSHYCRGSIAATRTGRVKGFWLSNGFRLSNWLRLEGSARTISSSNTGTERCSDEHIRMQILLLLERGEGLLPGPVPGD